MSVFDVWLREKLAALDSDDQVYSEYIKGVLDGEETEEEKQETLEEIVAGITDVDVVGVCQEIFRQWKQAALSETKAETPLAQTDQSTDFETRLSRLMEEQTRLGIVPKAAASVATGCDDWLKKSVLQKYAEVSDYEDSDDGEEGGTGEKGPGQPAAVHNANREETVRAEKERREAARKEAQAKREKDKLDREKQKQMQAEKKDKEKQRTQKGERRK